MQLLVDKLPLWVGGNATECFGKIVLSKKKGVVV